MINNNFETPPILLIVYKRPNQTQLVFESIRRAKPKKLFIYGDGPKSNCLIEKENITKVKEIVSLVDWECDLITNFSNINLGSKVIESTAISYFFSKVDYGIILEDDCLPNDSFYYFCHYLLTKYLDNERVMHIGGYTLVPENYTSSATYYYSNIIHAWGWASWSRAWKHYDVAMKDFPQSSFNNNLQKIFTDKKMAKYYFKNLLNTYKGKIDCWDYQWGYAIWKNDGVCITPTINLVSNIGFGQDGTYCREDFNKVGNLETHKLLAINSPYYIDVNYENDKYEFHNYIKKKFSFYLKHYPLKIYIILLFLIRKLTFR